MPVLALILSLFSSMALAWNGTGHRLIAQIAYDYLNPQAKSMCSDYLRLDSNSSLESKFVATSTWLDSVRKATRYHLDPLHYIDIPFSTDGTELPKIKAMNALTAIQRAVKVLSSTQEVSPFIKDFHLRVLLHVVGDIHQPLHTVTKVSHDLPQGDQGGNLFILAANPVGGNLHQYWDNGGGALLLTKSSGIQAMAKELEAKWPCDINARLGKPKQWIKQSNRIAKRTVYKLHPHTSPNRVYQLKAQKIAKRQIALGGCRLAKMLNQIALNYS